MLLRRVTWVNYGVCTLPRACCAHSPPHPPHAAPPGPCFPFRRAEAGQELETRISDSESESESCGSPGPFARTGKFPAGPIGNLTGEPESGASGSGRHSPPEYCASVTVPVTSMLCCVPTYLSVRTIQNPRFREMWNQQAPRNPRFKFPFVRREQS
jgi:hypothetical protein